MTRQTRCWPSSEATAHPSLPTEVKSSLARAFLLSPAKLPRWVSPGTPLRVILPRRTPALLLRPQAAQQAFLLLCGSLLAAPGNRPQIAAQRLDRVDRDDFSAPPNRHYRQRRSLNYSFSVAAANRCLNPIFLRASTLCRISLEIFWALPLQTYQGRSFRELRGVPINIVLVLINAERRTTIRSP